MPLLDRPGRFRAKPVDWSVDQKDDGPPFFKMLFKITAGPGEGVAAWDDWSGYDFQITGYFYLFKKDGSSNLITIDKLKQSLGWDGIDLVALQNAKLGDLEVQIEAEQSEWEGKQRLKVSWIHPSDYQPGLKIMEPQKVKTLAAQWGSKLRAVAPTNTDQNAVKPPARPPAKAVVVRLPVAQSQHSSGKELPEFETEFTGE